MRSINNFVLSLALVGIGAVSVLAIYAQTRPCIECRPLSASCCAPLPTPSPTPTPTPCACATATVNLNVNTRAGASVRVMPTPQAVP